MDSQNYKIVFEKLREAQDADASVGAPSPDEIHLDELKEIDELRRLALALLEPDQTAYTTT